MKRRSTMRMRKRMQRKKRQRSRRRVRLRKRRLAKKVKKMSKRKLKEYKQLLLKEKELVTGEIQHIAKEALNKSQKDASGDISGYTYHMADVATDAYDREFSLGIASSEREILYEINEALKRIEEDSYGSCLECSKPIAEKRLKAVPHTKYCIKCQKILETEKA